MERNLQPERVTQNTAGIGRAEDTSTLRFHHDVIEEIVGAERHDGRPNDEAIARTESAGMFHVIYLETSAARFDTRWIANPANDCDTGMSSTQLMFTRSGSVAAQNTVSAISSGVRASAPS